MGRLYQMGRVAERVSNIEEARRLFEQSLALYQELGERWWTARVLYQLSYASDTRDAYGEPKTLAENALAIFQSLGDPRYTAYSLTGLGWYAVRRGQLEEGEQLMQQCLDLTREMGERVMIGWGLQNLGATAMYLGKYAKAQSLLEESLTLRSDLGDPLGMADSTCDLGLAKMHLGQYDQARDLGEKALSLAQESDYPRRTGFCFLLLGSVALARSTCADAQELLQKGVVVLRGAGNQNDLGLLLGVLACAERGLGRVPQAERHASEASRIGSGFQFFRPWIYALPALSLLLADGGEVERATELYALASRYPIVADSRWFEDVAGREIATAAAALPPDVVAAAQERGQARDLWVTVEELLDEFEE